MKSRYGVILLCVASTIGYAEISKFSDPISERKTTYAPISGKWEVLSGEVVELNRREATFRLKNRKGEKTDFTYGDLVHVYRHGRRVTFMDLQIGDDLLIKYATQADHSD